MIYEKLKRSFHIVLTLCLVSGLFAGLPGKAYADDDVLPEVTEESSFTGGGYAATGQLENAGYADVLYDAANALPTSDANYVLEDENGYIWIGGYAGVIRYDGRDFERLDSSDGLTSGRVMMADGSRLWVGTNDNGVVVLDHGKTHRHFTYESNLPSASIRAFARDDRGYVYIGTANGLAYVDNVMMLHAIREEGLVNKTITRLSTGADSVIYGITGEGDLFRIESGNVDILPEDGPDYGNVKTVFADPLEPGYVYIGTENAIYYGKYGESTEKLVHIDMSNRGGVHWISRECDRIWVITDEGVGYLDTRNHFHTVHINSLTSKPDMLTSDYQGNIWIASSRQGVIKIVTNNFLDLAKESQADMGVVNSTCRCGNLLYIGTDSGLMILDENNNPVSNALTGMLQDVRIRCIAKDSEDTLWISTFTNDMGVVLFHPDGSVESYSRLSGLPSNQIRCTAMSWDGTVLVGTQDGIAVISGGKVVKRYGKKEGLGNTVILSLALGEDGTIYAGTDGDGLYIIKGNAVRGIGRKDGLTSDVILKVREDKELGCFWLITSNSIEHLKNGIVTNVASFPYNNNFDIFPDDAGNRWIVSSCGIYSVRAEDLFMDSVKDYKLVTLSNGLSALPTANSFSCLEDTGELYLCTRQGVDRVNIRHYFDQAPSLKIDLASVYADDTLLVRGANGAYAVPSGVEHLKITPAVLDYSLTDPLIHAYLEGADDLGVTMELSNLVPLEYMGLDYGHYLLHIEILDKTTKEPVQARVFRIEKAPRVTELILFRILLFLLVTGLICFLIWRHMKGTFRKRQDSESRYAREEVEKANAVKTRFLANMSREILTPVNTIRGMNELASREDATGVPKKYLDSMMNYFQITRDASDTLLEVIRDLFDMSRIESGKMTLNEQEYDVLKFLRSVVSMIRERSVAKGLSFDVDVDEILPKRLYGDVGKIRQIVLNLLSNAVLFTELGGFSLKVSMPERTDDICVVRFSVKDTGMGMTEENMKNLFRAYERMDEEKDGGRLDIEIGLDISNRLAGILGGTLEGKSEYGEGSEFILTIRQKIVDDTPVGAFDEYEGQDGWVRYLPKFVAPDADILVVDDDPVNLGIIKGMLRETGVFVSTASSAEECLNKIKSTRFNVVFLDHQMPGMDGIEIISWIREQDRDLPVYAITEDPGAVEEFYTQRGFTGFLTKPVDGADLEKTIMKHLAEEMMEKT